MTEEDPAAGEEPEGTHSDAFVAGGRTDYEKLVELLGFPESTHLEFKRGLDLESNAAKLNFVKDVVAMSNTPPGGYILIGVDNNGTPCIPTGTIDRPRFDPARLADLVRRYVDGRVDLRISIHDHNGCEIIVIFVVGHPDGLPLPMNKTGEHPDPDPQKSKTVLVFRQGDLPVREGAANVPLRRAHWPAILAFYTRQVRDQANETAQALLREFLDDRNQARAESPGQPAEVPLLLEMDEATFAGALQTLLAPGGTGDVRLRRFLKTVAKSLNSQADTGDFQNALDKWAIFCAQALFVERTDLVTTAIETLRDQYAELGITSEDTRRRLETVIRIYAVGSMAIRETAWSTVHELALQPVPSNPYDSNYIYSSWIRHGQVDASRQNVMPDERGGYLISASRELLVEHPAMRPDVQDGEIPPPAKDLAHNDELANSLCQFDLAYCLIVEAEGKYNGSAYPSSVALKDFRANPVAHQIVTKQEIRNALFPGSNNATIAHALAEVYAIASRESARYGMFWDVPHPVRQFIAQYPNESS